MSYKPPLILDHKVTHFTALIIRRFSRETFLVNYSGTIREYPLEGARLSAARKMRDEGGERQNRDRISEVRIRRGRVCLKVIFEGNEMEERDGRRTSRYTRFRASSCRSREKSGIAACEETCDGGRSRNEVKKKGKKAKRKSLDGSQTAN